MSNLTILVPLCVALVAACGGKKEEGGGGGKVASCNMPTLFSCREYREANLELGTDNLKKVCAVVDTSATFAESACSTEKLVGTCQTPSGKDYYYEGFPGDAASIAKNCSAMGGK